LPSAIKRETEARRARGSDLAASLYALANSCFFEQNYDEAEGYFLRALSIREKALGPDHVDVAESLNGLAKLYRVKKLYEEARALALHKYSGEMNKSYELCSTL
jgi:tetratricopeptide (TPR) repeat protein